MDDSEVTRLSQGLEKTQSDVTRLELAIGTLGSRMENLVTGIDALTKRMDEGKRTSFTLINPALWVLGGLITIGAAYISLQLSNSFRPLDQKVSALETNVGNLQSRLEEVAMASRSSASADASSIKDREQLNTRVRELEGRATDVAGKVSGLQANVTTALGEIEQQFRALSQVENLRWAHQERWNCTEFEDTHANRRCVNEPWFAPSIFKDTPPTP